MAWPELLSEIDLGPRTAANRIVLGPHRTNLAGSGVPGDAWGAYFLERARGGVGTIVLGELTLMANDRPYDPMIEVYDDRALELLAGVAAKLKHEGALVLAQLNHRGFQSSGVKSRLPTWGPVAMADVINCETCKAMEPEDIEDLVDCFALQAGRLRRAGFDGLEVSIGPNSLLRQFLSPMSNHRSDAHGGDLTGRLRLCLEVLAAVRRAVGPDCLVGVELCLDEKFWGGLTLEETIPAARQLAGPGGADYLAATLGTFYNLHLRRASMHHPPGLALDLAAALKQAVGVPVMAGNRITGPDEAEAALTQGAADLIRWVRPLVCDPALPAKLAADRAEDVVGCAFDNQDCLGRTNAHRGIACIQNPRAGREGKLSTPSAHPARDRKRVLIVGAGPAGLSAAFTLARRGHAPEVYDQNDEPGGQVRLARLAPGRSEIGRVVDNLVAALDRLGVPLHLGREMDLEAIMAAAPEAVILATGSRPKPRPVAGDYGPPGVLNVWQVLEGTYPIGERVLLVDEDGHHQAAGTAEWLADQGRRVEIITSEPYVGVELAGQGDIVDTKTRLLAKGVAFVCDQVVSGISDGGITTRDRYSGQVTMRRGYDTVVLVMGNTADDGLYRLLKGRLPSVQRVGDCVAPRRIGAAVREGFFGAMRV